MIFVIFGFDGSMTVCHALCMLLFKVDEINSGLLHHTTQTIAAYSIQQILPNVFRFTVLLTDSKTQSSELTFS